MLSDYEYEKRVNELSQLPIVKCSHCDKNIWIDDVYAYKDNYGDFFCSKDCVLKDNEIKKVDLVEEFKGE